MKTVMPMNSPVGDAKTWPVPSGLTDGFDITPKIVSLVPIEIAI